MKVDLWRHSKLDLEKEHFGYNSPNLTSTILFLLTIYDILMCDLQKHVIYLNLCRIA